MANGHSPEIGEKDVDTTAVRRSVIDLPAPSLSPPSSITDTIIWNVGGQADEFEIWGRNTRMRDRQLRDFITRESMFASALATVASRNASFGWVLEGPPRLVKRFQRIMEDSDFGRGWASLMVKVSIDLYSQDNSAFIEVVRERDSADSPLIGLNHLDSARCLGRDSRVQLSDGSTKAIRDMVLEKNPGPVLSLNSVGQLEAQAVTGWYESKLADRFWIKMRLKGSKHIFGRRESLRLTNDHEVLTSDGWQRAEHLSVGTCIVTDDWVPTSAQMELVLGTLLGDASLISSTGDSVALCLGQSEKQKEWLKVKQSALAGFGWSPTRGDSFKQITSSRTPALADLYTDFWVDGRRRVPRALVEANFGPRMLAAWYGDDGSFNRGRQAKSGLALWTNGLLPEDSEWLAELLTTRGYAAHTRKHRTMGCEYTFISLNQDSAQHFLRDIAAYLPSCLRHKLPDSSPEYDSSLWELGTAERWAAPIELIERVSSDQTAAYCIDVAENHNFVAAGMVVHNCIHTGAPEFPVIYINRKGEYKLLAWYQVIVLSEMPMTNELRYGMQICALTRLLTAVQIQRNIAIYDFEKTGGRNTRAIQLVRGISATAIQDAINIQRSTNDSRGLRRYSDPLIVSGVDPTADVGHDTIELASLPDDFDRDNTMKWYVAQIAMAFLEDYQTFAPLPGGNLGTSTQSQVLHDKARGRGPALFMNMVSHALNFVVLPENVEFQWDDKDIAEEKFIADTKVVRATERATRIASGEITPQVARQIALEAGDLTQEQLDLMGGSTDTDVTVDNQSDPDAQLGEDKPIQPATNQPGPTAPPGAAPKPGQPTNTQPASKSQEQAPTASEGQPDARLAVEQEAADAISSVFDGLRGRITRLIEEADDSE